MLDRLRMWTYTTDLPRGVELHVAGTRRRCGKAVAIHAGIEYTKQLVAEGELQMLPELFFSMDADSSLAPGTLERMAFRLMQRRRIARTPHLIVTSNVMVPVEQCWMGWRSLLRMRDWIGLLVAREYLTSISLGRHNSKLFPGTVVSGALYCTWMQVAIQAPRYAHFMQTLRFRDWLKWWLGWAPPRFTDYRGAALPEAMTGPGDDTWMAWMACTGTWRGGRLCFDAPRSPLHAFGRMVLCYVSRPLAYHPQAIVFTKTPTNPTCSRTGRSGQESWRHSTPRWCRSFARRRVGLVSSSG